jgi:hypothetical protein
MRFYFERKCLMESKRAYAQCSHNHNVESANRPHSLRSTDMFRVLACLPTVPHWSVKATVLPAGLVNLYACHTPLYQQFSHELIIRSVNSSLLPYISKPNIFMAGSVPTRAISHKIRKTCSLSCHDVTTALVLFLLATKRITYII